MRSAPPLTVLAAASVFGLFGDQAAGRPIPLERVYAEPGLSGEAAHGVALSPDGRYVSYLTAGRDDPKAALLMVRPVDGGPARQLLDTRALGAPATGLTEAAMKALERRHQVSGDALDYRWSPGSDRILANTAGELYLIPVEGGPPRPIPRAAKDPPGQTRSDPQLAPGGRYVSFVAGGNLHIREIATGTERVVGADAGDDVLYGEPDFITQEEIQRFTGAWWSPDGSRIAYTRTDVSGVTKVNRVRIDAAGISAVEDRFPLAGTANSDVRLFVQAVGEGGPVAVDLGPDPDVYIFDVAWSLDGSTLYVQRQSRDQKRLDLLAVDPVTGRGKVLVSETSPTWVDLERTFRPLRGGQFLWGSSRTGWRHLYLYDGSGRLIRAVTSGAWRIAALGAQATPGQSPIIGVDEVKGLVYFIASKETPVERQLYVVSYRRPGVPRQITTGHGWWTPTMAADRPTAFVGDYSDPVQPPQTALYDLTGARRAWLAENRLGPDHPLFPYLDQRPTYGFGEIQAADGEALDYVMAKPAGFDPARRYPVIVKVYGGPGVQTVRREWRPLTEQIYTQAGYIVFQLDNRGSINRSEAFEHAIAGALGGVSTDDQIAGVRFLRGLPFVDPDRIGMTGWSFGGYTAARALMTPGSGLRAGAAGGVPSMFELYDTHYTERFLGKPADHAQAYATAGLLGRARDLHGELILFHGLSDDNVSLSNFTALVTELEKQGKTFETSVFPGQGHAVRGEAAQTRLLKSILGFFDRTLKPSVAAGPAM
jgi:dipeptidyl-peptidase-4